MREVLDKLADARFRARAGARCPRCHRLIRSYFLTASPTFSMAFPTFRFAVPTVSCTFPVA
jgi:hypothetical protein